MFPSPMDQMDSILNPIQHLTNIADKSLKTQS